jgi:uncharacterized membrane protein
MMARAASVMERVSRLVTLAEGAGKVTPEEGAQLLEDIGDVATVYVVASRAMMGRREARLDRERSAVEGA